MQGECHLPMSGAAIVESNPSYSVPGGGTTFAPLPSGEPAACLTPERIREQLGWGLLQPTWR